MRVKALNSIVKLIDRISNPSSLTPLYRSIEFGENSIKACSEFGNIHILCSELGMKDKALIDCSYLRGVTQNLPQEAEIFFEEKPDKINWSCGNATGRLNHVVTDNVVPAIDHDSFPWTPPADFGNALQLASCACQAAAVTIGLYGVTLEPEGDKLHILSSNSISLASTIVEKGTYPTGKITLRPPVPSIIATLITACPNCVLDITDDGVFIIGDWLMAHLPISQALDHDLKKLSDKFAETKEVAKINPYSVKTFITRAKSLTERQSNFTVSIKVEDGKLMLSHIGIGSSSEEWMLCEGLDPALKYDSVSLPADLLTLPLEFVQYAVLDYFKDQQLVLRGGNPNFCYVVGGGQ